MEQFLGLPPDGSAHGPAIDHLIGLIHWLMAVLFVGWGTFFIFTLVRFRKARQAKANYTGVKSHMSSYLEVGVLVVEVVLLVGFSVPLWSKRVDAFPAEKDATVIRVVAEQFTWNIHYPGADGKFGRTAINLIDSDNPLGLDRTDPDARDDIVTINDLHLPVNKPVLINLTTKDVIHSFNLPAFRVKQDAVPGMSIPLWFTPVKTTDQIREELRRAYPVGDLLKNVITIHLPQPSSIQLKPGMDMEGYMVMGEFTDSTGGTILSKGDPLSKENIGKLLDAHIGEVNARPMATADAFVTLEEYKDTAGNVAVMKGESLSEDAISKLIEMGMKDVRARHSANMDTYVVMESYTDKSGTQLAAKGDPISEELLTTLADAGIPSLVVAPATPTEIACAQLCGLGHYRMRGYVTIQTADEYQQWFNSQEALLSPPSEMSEQSPEQSNSTTGDASTATQQGSPH